MARPLDFEPKKVIINDDDAEARTLPKRITIVAHDIIA